MCLKVNNTIIISPKTKTAGPETKYRRFKPFPKIAEKTSITLRISEKSKAGKRLKTKFKTKPITKNISFKIKLKIKEIKNITSFYNIVYESYNSYALRLYRRLQRQ